MSERLQFGEELARKVEATYLTPDVVVQRQEVLKVLELRPGERVLDIGSGPGLLALEMGLAVGPSGRVSGIDNSESMVAMSRRRCSGNAQIEFQVGDAMRLPFPDGDFDVAVSTQVYEYVKDMTAALAELHRVLRVGGRALIVDTDWESIVWHSGDSGRMVRVLRAWDEHLVDPHLPRTLAPQLKRAGFILQRRQVIPLFNPEYDPDTFSGRMIGLIAAFVANRQGIRQEEATAWADDLQRRGKEGSYFFSLNRYLFLAVKPRVG